MAKGQMRSNKETRKPKAGKEKVQPVSSFDPVKAIANPVKLPAKK
jgi:hypothetical protein